MSNLTREWASTLSPPRLSRVYIFWLYLLGGLSLACAELILSREFGFSSKATIILFAALLVPAHFLVRFLIRWFQIPEWLDGPVSSMFAFSVIVCILLAFVVGSQPPPLQMFTVSIDDASSSASAIQLHELGHELVGFHRRVEVTGGKLNLTWRVSGQAEKCQVLTAVRTEDKEIWSVSRASKGVDGDWSTTLDPVDGRVKFFEIRGIAAPKEASLSKVDPFENACTVSSRIRIEVKWDTGKDAKNARTPALSR
jgi:hypothetical protein